MTSTRIVHDPDGFAVVIDPHSDDPICRDLAVTAARQRSFKGRLKQLFRKLFRHFTSGVPESCQRKLLRRLVRPGSRVLDLGAHIGTFTLAAAAWDCEVLAVEASPRNAELLQAAVGCNGFDRVHVIVAVVSDRSGTILFSPYGPYGHVATPATSLPRIEVPAVRADDLLAEFGWDRVAFVKMDIEGSEVAALEGMRRLLSRPDAPPILYESNAYALAFYGQTPAALRHKLESFGYRSYRPDSPPSLPVRPDELQPEVVMDFLAVKSAGGAPIG